MNIYQRFFGTGKKCQLTYRPKSKNWNILTRLSPLHYGSIWLNKSSKKSSVRRNRWNKFQLDILKTWVFSYTSIAHLLWVVFTKKPMHIFWLSKSKNRPHHHHSGSIKIHLLVSQWVLKIKMPKQHALGWVWIRQKCTPTKQGLIRITEK